MNTIVEKDLNRIRKSDLFDAEWYVKTYPDVAMVGMEPAEHFYKYGGLLKRNPSFLINMKDFFIDCKLDSSTAHPFLCYLDGLKSGEIKRNLLFEAFKASKEYGIYETYLSALSIANEKEKSALNCLLANLYIEDEIKWLQCINEHLNSYGLEPIELSQEKSKGLYYRIAMRSFSQFKEGPLVTIIMPAFNAEGTIHLAIDSILNQTWGNIELIVIDDCSQDNTFEIARNYAYKDLRVKVLKNEINMGPYVSKNRALKISNGEYITGHDADDWAHPRRIELHIKEVLKNKEINKVTAIKMIRMRGDGGLDRFSKLTENTADGITQAAFISTMFEMSFFKRYIGAWDCVRFGGDSEIINRCKTIAPDCFKIFNILGLICLDSDSGLTAHPEFGTRGVMSPVRKKYKKSFMKWHQNAYNKSSVEKLKMHFPPRKRLFMAPESATVDATLIKRNLELCEDSNIIDVDVCFITDLRFPGGNASTTITEAKELIKAGKKIKIIHLPTFVSERKPISEKYNCLSEVVDVEYYAIGKICCDVLIVRHPSVVVTQKFKQLIPIINCNHAAIIVNNSIYRANYERAYDIQEFVASCHLIHFLYKVYPLSPVIREELLHFLDNKEIPIGNFDWTPVFNIDKKQSVFIKKFNDQKKLVIGRHGRDQEDKWPDSKEDLLAAYPNNPSFKIKILGGAEKLKKKLGQIPNNWEVFEFGTQDPVYFLSGLDFFVYYPSNNLREAFGRVIVEAIISGIPCILPPRFEHVFGDMCFYAEVLEVEKKIENLILNEEGLAKHCCAARTLAINSFSSDVLLKRLRVQ